MRPLLLPLAALLACARPAEPPPDAGTAPPDPECPAGRSWNGAGEFCQPLVAVDCPPGTRAVVGQDSCAPVGPPTCTGGFRRAASGWGCEAVLPASGCAGAALALPGGEACQPIGDCAAPFPPQEATLFVDDDYDPSQLDATHFGTIGAALSAATAGATIAVEAGTYVEALDFTRSAKVIGRCAGQVLLRSPGGLAPGLKVTRPVEVSVRGMTISEHRGGAVVAGGGRLELAESVVFDNRDLGLMIVDASSHASLRRVAVRATRPTAQGTLGRGLNIEAGPTVVLSESAVEGNREVGIFALGSSRLELSRSAVLDTAPSGSTGGRGVYLKNGATLVMRDSVLVRNHDIGLFAIGAGSVASVEDSVIEDTRGLPDGSYGRGLSVQEGAQLTLLRSTLRANHDTGLEVIGAGALATVEQGVIADTRSNAAGEYGMGAFVKEGGSLQFKESAIVDSRAAGLVALGPNAFLAVLDGLVQGTEADRQASFGFGVLAAGGADVAVAGSAVLDSQSAGVIAISAGTRLRLSGALVSDVAPEPGGEQFGHAAVVLDGARLDAAGSVLRRAAGIGLAYAGASGVVSDSLVGWNAVGIHAQDGSQLSLHPAPPASLGSLEVALTESAFFFENASRTGAGVVPLPDPSGIYR